MKNKDNYSSKKSLSMFDINCFLWDTGSSKDIYFQFIAGGVTEMNGYQYINCNISS